MLAGIFRRYFLLSFYYNVGDTYFGGIMKYICAFISSLLIFSGCAAVNRSDYSKSAPADEVKQKQPAVQEEIKDEEFDLLVAPEYNYEDTTPYAEQILNNPNAPKKAKPVKKVVQ